MGEMEAEDYWESINRFCDLCEGRLKGGFVSFIVVGSVGAGDFIPGWSDVDGWLAVKRIRDDTASELQTITEKIVEEYPFYRTDRGPWFSAMLATEDDFLCDAGSLSALSKWDVKYNGIVARGKDFRNKVSLTAIDRSWLDSNTRWMLEFLERDRAASAFWKLRNSVGFTLCGARNALLKEEVYRKRYDDILVEFSKLHEGEAAIVREAHGIRKEWRYWREQPLDTERIYLEAIRFLRWCLDWR